MAEAHIDDNLTEEEILLQQQRKEKKELQARVQQIRHGVPKGDKKRKKEATAEIARLEAELEQQHQQRQEQLASSTKPQVSDVCEDMDRLTTADNEDSVPNAQEGAPKNKKPSKAKRRREKKAAQDREREERIQQADEDNLTGARHIEATKLKEILTKRSLSIHEVPSDGNCLYAAVKHQLSMTSIQTTVDQLRKQAADYMRTQAEEMMLFLSNPNTGEPLTHDEYEKYCDDLENTTAWGGQLEIRALASVLRLPIEVIQAEGPSILTGEEHPPPTLILSYHRHAFGLGEHYNSIIPKEEEENEDDGFT